MKLVKSLPAEAIRVDDRVTTEHWSASSDGKPFTVVKRFTDGWFLCLDSKRRYRQFHRDHVKRIEEE